MKTSNYIWDGHIMIIYTTKYFSVGLLIQYYFCFNFKIDNLVRNFKINKFEVALFFINNVYTD